MQLPMDKRLKFQKGRQGEFLETVIYAEFNNLEGFAKFAGFSRRCLFDMRREKILLPKRVFEKICKIFPKYEYFSGFIIEELHPGWGAKKGREKWLLRIKEIQKRIKASLINQNLKEFWQYAELLKKHKTKVEENNRHCLKSQSIITNPVLDTSVVFFSKKDLIKKVILPRELSLDLCYVIGAHIGDGSMNIYRSTGRVDYLYNFCCQAINERDWYKNVLIPLYKKLFNLELKNREFLDGTCGIQFRSKAVLSFYNKSCGLPLGKKCGVVDIPSIVLDAGLSHTLACISGIFDTDFHFGFKNKNKTVHSYQVVVLKTKSPNLVKRIAIILDKIGISHSTRVSKIFDKRIGKEDIGHCISISGRRNSVKWFDLIGSRNPNYLSKYLIWKKYCFCPPNLNYYQRKEILDGNKNPLEFYNSKMGQGGIEPPTPRLSVVCSTTEPQAHHN